MDKTAQKHSENDSNLIESVTEALGCTNQSLADSLGIPRHRVESWRYHSVSVPPDCLRAIIRLLVGRVNGAARIQEIAARAVQRAGETRKPRRNPQKVTP